MHLQGGLLQEILLMALLKEDTVFLPILVTLNFPGTFQIICIVSLHRDSENHINKHLSSWIILMWTSVRLQEDVFQFPYSYNLPPAASKLFFCLDRFPRPLSHCWFEDLCVPPLLRAEELQSLPPVLCVTAAKRHFITLQCATKEINNRTWQRVAVWEACGEWLGYFKRVFQQDFLRILYFV